jgi:uncharacterized protein (TIGR03663 family)
MRGQHTLASLDERTLRGVPAAFGAATILLVLLLAPGIGRTATAAGAWLLALSPAMVFYSRMFIQESLFACFALAFAVAVGRAVTAGGFAWFTLAGIAAGLAVATKETAIIVLPAAVVACGVSWWSLNRARPESALAGGRWRMPAIVGLAAAVAVIVLFYSSFFSAPEGILAPFGAAGTYLARGVEPVGHTHPWHYYFKLLAYSSSGGLRWSEAVVLVLAIIGGIYAVVGRAEGAEDDRPESLRDRAPLILPRAWAAVSVTRAFWSRYLTVYAAIVALVFSAIPYKTPWNLLPFYVVLLVVAGIGFSALVHATRNRAARASLAALLVIASVHLGWQAWRAAVTYAADPRNPYVYAQTVPDAVRMATRILDLAALHADGGRMQVSVIASPYEQWPLPWYLRTMPNVGYWIAPGDPLATQAPVIVSSMDHAPALDEALDDRYVSEFYGLRPDVLLALYVDRGLWDRFLADAAGKARVSP